MLPYNLHFHGIYFISPAKHPTLKPKKNLAYFFYCNKHLPSIILLFRELPCWWGPQSQYSISWSLEWRHGPGQTSQSLPEILYSGAKWEALWSSFFLWRWLTHLYLSHKGNKDDRAEVRNKYWSLLSPGVKHVLWISQSHELKNHFLLLK